MASIFPFFEWCEKTALFRLISTHESFFPALETIHLFGLVLLLGTTVILSLRLLGVIMARQPVPELARELANYTASGLALMLSSGVLMFVATAVRNYSNTSFWVKMVFLATALLFHFAYFRKVIRMEDSGIARRRGKRAAWGALILWFGVAAAGRSIGFLG
jgi:hypothetical protein